MSRSYVINARMLRKRAKKLRTPEEASLMSFFGATDFNRKTSDILDQASLDDFGTMPGFLADTLLPMPESIPLDNPLELFAPETGQKETYQEDQVAVLSAKSEHGQPILLPEHAQNDQVNEEPATDDLQELLAFLNETEGIGVSEVKELSSGINRITVDEYMGSKKTKTREPEFVMA